MSANRSPVANLWLSDPSWLEMDLCARGMHAQLIMAAALRRPAGTLPDDDLTWRRLAGWPMPAQNGKSKKTHGRHSAAMPPAHVIEETEAEEAVPGSAEWADRLWKQRWKPMLLAAWQRIDEALVVERPELAKAAGGWWSEVSALLAWKNEATVAATHPEAGNEAAGGKKTRGRTVSGAGRGVAKTANTDAGHGDLDVPAAWHDHGHVFRTWQVPADEASRQSMWEVGVQCLAIDGNVRAARGLIGRLIKRYGETAVGEAIGALAVRQVPPADAGAFLAAMLRRSQEGSEAEQSARRARARVAL